MLFRPKHKKEDLRYIKKILFYLEGLFLIQAIAWFWSDKRINKNISYKINGLELLLRYQKLNKGILLF